MTKDTSMTDETKCPKCGGRLWPYGGTAACHCESCHSDWDISDMQDDKCLRRQLTAKTTECEQAQAACAAMRPLLNKLHFHMKYWGSQEDGVPEDMYANWKAAFEVANATNCGQPILDELAKLRAENADLRAKAGQSQNEQETGTNLPLCSDADLDRLWDGIQALPGYDAKTGCAEFIRLATDDVLAKVGHMFRNRIGSSQVDAWFLADGHTPDLRRIANRNQLQLACAHRALEIALGRSHRTGGESMYSRLRDYHRNEYDRAMGSLVLMFRPAATTKAEGVNQ